MLNSVPNRQIANVLALGILVLVAASLLGFLGSIAKLQLVAAAIVFFLAMSVAFVRGTEGLYLVIFAMLFSPELVSELGTGKTIGEGAGGIVVRLEDVIMLAVVVGWVARSSYMHRSGGIVRTPVNSAIWLYITASVIATLAGILGGTVPNFLSGFFHNLKYFEYFLLFFMILAHVRTRETVIRMLGAMFIAFFLAMAYGYTQIGRVVRVSAPFDTEPNTFGGYIVLMICVAAGIALADKRARVRGTMIFLILFALPPLLFTLSRASYMAMTVAVLAFVVVSRTRIVIGAVALAVLAAVFLGLPLFPEQVQERVGGTFERESQYHVQIAGIDFDASSSARLIAYGDAVEDWFHKPVLGYGVTGTQFIDGQYVRLLVETGAIGLLAFLFVFWRLIKSVYRVSRSVNDPFMRGASTGFLCGIVAMLAHALSANSFIIVRIAEPFWILAGLILVMPRLESGMPEDGTARTVRSNIACQSDLDQT